MRQLSRVCRGMGIRARSWCLNRSSSRSEAEERFSWEATAGAGRVEAGNVSCSSKGRQLSALERSPWGRKAGGVGLGPEGTISGGEGGARAHPGFLCGRDGQVSGFRETPATRTRVSPSASPRRPVQPGLQRCQRGSGQWQEGHLRLVAASFPRAPSSGPAQRARAGGDKQLAVTWCETRRSSTW